MVVEKRFSWAVLLRNALSGSSRYVIVAGLYLWIIPVMVRHLGLDRFGIWAVLGSLILSPRSLDLGLGAGITKFMAEAVGGGDDARANSMFWAGATVSLLFATALGFLLWLARPIVLGNILRVGPENWEEAYGAFGWACLALWFKAASSAGSAGLSGLQRMDLDNAVQTVSSLAAIVTMWYALESGGGLEALIIINLVSYAFAAFLSLVLVRRLLAFFGPTMVGLRRVHLRAILRYGIVVQVGSLATMVLDPLMKLSIGSMLSLHFTGIYEVGSRAASVLVQLLAAGGVALMPASASLGTDHHDVAPNIYVRSLRYMTLMATPGTLLILTFAQPFSTLWIGGNREALVGWTIWILAIAGWMSLVATPAYCVAQGIGLERLSTGTMLITALLAGLLVLPALATLGYYGGVVAYGLAVFGGWLYLSLTFSSAIGINSFRVLRHSVAKPLAVNLPIFLVALLVLRSSPIEWTWGRLIAGTGVYFVSTIIATWAGGGLTKSEKLIVGQAFLHHARQVCSTSRERIR